MLDSGRVGVLSFPGHSESMLFFMAVGISVLYEPYSSTQNSYLCICWSWIEFLELQPLSPESPRTERSLEK